ncbi:MAG: sigma-70 family RNA polymerase sigma factor [Actinomycetota bacterium]|nr:sigma-70 family RNA polymerase sigma factor [Actinomycetota bacterium]
MTAPAATRGAFDRESRVWLAQLRGDGLEHDAALVRLHALLLDEARYEMRRRTQALAHPSGPDLDDLALQAANDALLTVLRKLDQFRGDALFTTWARRFAQLEVPGKIRRRLGHTRETPTDPADWPPERLTSADPQEHCEARELARTLAHLIAHDLTARQREVLLALTVEHVTVKHLAERMDSTPGALYKTLHDARGKLKRRLADEPADTIREAVSGRSRPPALLSNAA